MCKGVQRNFLDTLYFDTLTSMGKGCPILRKIYAWHCIVLYPSNNRLTIQ